MTLPTVRTSSSSANKAKRRHHQQKQRSILFHNNVFLHQRHYLHVLLLMLCGMFVMMYFFVLSGEQRTQQQAASKIKHYLFKNGGGGVPAAAGVTADGVVGKVVQQGIRSVTNGSGGGTTTTSSSSSTMLVANAHSASRITITNRPFLLYGTAWKKDRTAEFVQQAILSGFRFIDTACQPKHYNEQGVGIGWTMAAAELKLDRSDIYIQTKFTSIDGQDPNNIPYDHTKSIPEQMKESLEVSLANLNTDYLDSWVLHSPYPNFDDTILAWKTMETFVDTGKVHRIGISNCYNYEKFTKLYELARIKPSVLQNRFYSDSNFDTELRLFCKQHNIWYQSFWTLTANRHALARPDVLELARSKRLTPQTLMFAFLMSLGTQQQQQVVVEGGSNGNGLAYFTPLSGTTNPKHMLEDVAIMERIEGGEIFFHNDEELRHFASILGMPAL